MVSTSRPVLDSLFNLYLYFLGPFGLTYLAVSIVLGAIFVYWNIRLIANPSRIVAWGNYKFSGVYLVVLLSAMLLDVVR